MQPKMVDCGVSAPTKLCPPVEAMATTAPPQMLLSSSHVRPNAQTLEKILIPIGSAILIVMLMVCYWLYRGCDCCRRLRRSGPSGSNVELANVSTGRRVMRSPPPRPILPPGGRAALESIPTRASQVSHSSQARIHGLMRDPNDLPLVHDHGQILGPPYMGILGIRSFPPHAAEPLRSWGNDLVTQGNRAGTVILTEPQQGREVEGDQTRWSASEQTLRDEPV